MAKMPIVTTLPKLLAAIEDAAPEILAVYESKTDDLGSLVAAAKLDPAIDLREADFGGMDLGKTDVAGWDFSGTNFKSANLSGFTNIHQATFSLETNLEGATLPEGITVQELPRPRGSA